MTTLREAIDHDLAAAPRRTPVSSLARRNRGRRTRRTAVTAGAIGVAIVTVVALSVALGPARSRRVVVHVRPSSTTAATIASNTARALAREHIDAELLFGDATGILVGDPNRGTLRRLPHSANVACTQCIEGFRVGGATVFSDGNTISVLAGNTMRTVTRGSVAFPAPDGRSIFVADVSQPAVAQWNLDGHRLGGPWTTPAGWGLTGGARGFDAHAVAGGILVETQENSTDHTLALWDPHTGAMRRIGRARWDVIDTYTATGGRSSTIAWIRAGCSTVGCDLMLTDTATWRTRRITAPPGHFGFWLGGAFSPDGRHLASFAGNVAVPSNPAVTLVVVDVTDGTSAAVDGGGLDVGEPNALAAWSPDGHWLFFSNYGEIHVHHAGTHDAVTLHFAVGAAAHNFTVTARR